MLSKASVIYFRFAKIILTMNTEKRKLINSIIVPTAIVLIIWLIKLGEIIFNINLGFLGIYPLKAEGLWGIICSPLLHSDLNHLYANTIPLFVLSAALFYFYEEIALKIFIYIYLTTDVWVWIIARAAWHIGASGLIYGLFSFIFVSGILRKHNRLMALSMFVIFLYGGLIWGIFPNNFQQEISWESHLMGLIAGLIFAFYFRDEGPQKVEYQWVEDEDEDDDYYMQPFVEEEEEKNKEVN